MLLELFNRDMPSGPAGELGTDEFLLAAKPKERIWGAFGFQELCGIGAGVRLELAEKLFVVGEKVWLC